MAETERCSPWAREGLVAWVGMGKELLGMHTSCLRDARE